MAVLPSSHPPLARAYLALADDPAPPAVQRSLPRALLALVATVVLAFAAPQAWASIARGEPRDSPAATAVKAGHDQDDADDDDDRGDGDPWAATNG
ncbi:MAG: hypothetical protein ABW081_03790 [Solirubrobacteraceae bacterium]